MDGAGEDPMLLEYGVTQDPILLEAISPVAVGDEAPALHYSLNITCGPHLHREEACIHCPVGHCICALTHRSAL